MKICDINDREFKIVALTIFNEMWENTDRQFNTLRKQVNTQNKYFTKEIKTLQKNQPEILELDEELNKRDQEWTSKHRK